MRLMLPGGTTVALHVRWFGRPTRMERRLDAARARQVSELRERLAASPDPQQTLLDEIRRSRDSYLAGQRAALAEIRRAKRRIQDGGS
jgi:hypothetical protein